MPRRGSEEKLRQYRRKLRIHELARRRCKRIIYSASNSDSSDNDETTNSDQSTNKEKSSAAESNEPGPDVIAAGGTIKEAPKTSPTINEKFLGLWLPILQKGINKDDKEKLIKEYPIPKNCPLLQAPKLNPEILTAISGRTRARDKQVEAVQQQIGKGITALNRGLELLLDNDTDKPQAIKYLSDSCRILCDLHHGKTDSRRKFIMSGLDEAFINIIEDLDQDVRDDLLFGHKLSEKIKATKVTENQGLQLKKPLPDPKMTSTPSTSRSRQRYRASPPRSSTDRGGKEQTAERYGCGSTTEVVHSERATTCDGSTIKIYPPPPLQPCTGGRSRTAFTSLDTPEIPLDLMIASI